MQNKEIEEQLNILIEERPTNKKEDALDNIKQYIQQLETKQQKVMKFLIECKKEYTEELKYNCTKRDARLQLQLVDMILEIMKGE